MILTSKALSNPEIIRNLGIRFRDYRLRLNMTRKEVSEEAGVGLTTIYKFETGNMKDVSFITLLRLLRAIGERENWENLLPELPESPYLYENDRKKQRVRHGKWWRISPAYDITFIFNPTATGANLEHVFSLEGKILDITRLDLINFGRKTGIRNPESIIDEVAAVVSRFPQYAEKNGLRQPYRSIIQKRLEDILIEFGYRDKATAEPFSDIDGKKISDFRISINTKGFFEISVIIDGKKQRRFVKPTMPQYEELRKSDIYNLSQEEKQALITALFLRS